MLVTIEIIYFFFNNYTIGKKREWRSEKEEKKKKKKRKLILQVYRTEHIFPRIFVRDLYLKIILLSVFFLQINEYMGVLHFLKIKLNRF